MLNMSPETIKLYDQAHLGRKMYREKMIKKSEAVKMIKPYLDVVNQRCIEIANKYNQKPKLLSFDAFIKMPQV